MASPCSFSKKNGPIMPLDQNPQQTVTRFGCVGFSVYACEFSVTQIATIWLVYIPAKIIWKDYFFLPKSASSISRSQVYLAKRYSSVYTTLFVRRKDKTNYLSNQTWAKCYYSRNKYYLKINVRWWTQFYNIFNIAGYRTPNWVSYFKT